MARAANFLGANLVLTPPKGMTEDQVSTLRAYKTPHSIVCCWQLEGREQLEVASSGLVWVSTMGHRFAPMFVGSETVMREFSADYGPLWPRQDRPPSAFLAVLKELSDLNDQATGASVSVPRDLIYRLIGATA